MAPLLALVLGTLGARLIGSLGVHYVGNWPAAVAVGLAVMFLVTGVAHFVNPLRRDLIAIVPPKLPALGPIAPHVRGLLVTVTGVLELLGAVGLLYPPTRVAAAISLGVMMLAMFPANVYASRMPSPPKSMTTALPLRTIEQFVFVGAALVVGLGGIQ
ncbi:DoxX family protein [Mycolicibacterium stellerae]|uniref:DoxX family protein n=1 Tax=Mycolicibacterium stellerae TaxID=2358193 RepID=UPI000F0B82E6|nr:DoxX family protein [Mycolicibacterium stellerae]